MTCWYVLTINCFDISHFEGSHTECLKWLLSNLNNTPAVITGPKSLDASGVFFTDNFINRVLFQ